MDENKDVTEDVEEVSVFEGESRNEEARIGNVKISVDVLATIAGVATMNCDGVYAMAGTFAGDIAERLGAKKNPNKGVKIEMNEKTAKVDLYIIVKYGVRIPELAWEIQEAVKNNIESMTGMAVEKVNIHIEGVNFDEEKPMGDTEEETSPLGAAVETVEE